MKIKNITSWSKDLELIRPYKIATKTITDVTNVFLKIILDDGTVGFGAASPAENVTGESIEHCKNALDEENIAWLIGQSIDDYQQLSKSIDLKPAATAAIDIALHDAFAKTKNLPLVDILGRHHHALPTSITIGIKSISATLDEAEEYLGRGFSVLKVKLGDNSEEDIERIIKLRERYADRITLRVDMNQGYNRDEFNIFARKTKHLNIELIEQPFPTDQVKMLDQLDDSIKQRIALDENILSVADAEKCKNVCGIFNIKLMKCGGILRAQKIANIAHDNNVQLMWGCNDESKISIAAALHVAFASQNTRYLDLDGSLDLARDIVQGGFTIEDGIMRTTDMPGLGTFL